jgi:putative transcriptional regulator
MEFAFMLGISSKVLDSWERGVTQPEGPAKALLRVAEYHPNAFYKILKKREA